MEFRNELGIIDWVVMTNASPPWLELERPRSHSTAHALRTLLAERRNSQARQRGFWILRNPKNLSLQHLRQMGSGGFNKE